MDVNVHAEGQSPLKRTSRLESVSAEEHGDLFLCRQIPAKPARENAQGLEALNRNDFEGMYVSTLEANHEQAQISIYPKYFLLNNQCSFFGLQILNATNNKYVRATIYSRSRRSMGTELVTHRKSDCLPLCVRIIR